MTTAFSDLEAIINAEPMADPQMARLEAIAESPTIEQLTDPKTEIDAKKKAAHMASAFFRSVGRGIGGMSKGVALAAKDLADWFPRVFPKDAERDVQNYVMYQNGVEIEEFFNKHFPGDPRMRESFFLEKVPAGFGSMAVFVAGGAAGRALKGSALATTAALGAGAEGAGQYEEAQAYGASEEDARLAARWGALIGMSEAVPVWRILQRYDKASGGQLHSAVSSAIRQGIAGTFEEGVQEVVQTAAGNKVAKEIYDTERKLVDGVLEAGEVGGIVGFVTNAIAAGAGVKLRGSQSRLLTPQGAREFAVAHPEAAEPIAAVEGAVSRRGPFEKMREVAPEENTKEWSAKNRKRFAELLRQEADNAKGLREDAGQLQEERAIRESREEEGRPDLQREPETQSKARQPEVPEGEVTEQPSTLANFKAVAEKMLEQQGPVEPAPEVATEEGPPPTAEEARVGDQLDKWQGALNVDKQRILVDAAKNQDLIKAVVGEKRYGEKSKELGQAILLNIDLVDKPDQIVEWGDKLTPSQMRIYQRSQNLAPAEQAIADRIIQQNRMSGEEAVAADVIAEAYENYAMRLWEPETKQRREAAPPKFGTSTARAKARTLESILHGWAKGKKLRIDDAVHAQQVARQQVSQVIHDRAMLKEAIKAGVIGTKQHEGWVQLQHPNMTRRLRYGKADLYAEPTLGGSLNRIVGQSGLKGIPGVDALTKWNAILKHLILTSSLFHHQALLRSYMFGGRGLNPVTGFFKGRDAIMNFTPELQDLLQQGLTLGEIQDFSPEMLETKTWIGEQVDRVPVAREVKDAMLKFRDVWTHWLFRRLQPFLKAQAGLLEYQHLLKKHDAKIKAGETTREEVARIVANLMNDDFGGLHHGMMHKFGDKEARGRNPTVQHAFRLGALAPDWTESNVRSMAKAFKGGLEGEVYRNFWAHIAVKAGTATVMFNLLAAAMGDEEEPAKEFIKHYKQAWEEGHLRWLDVDVTPLYRVLGGDGKKKYFSLVGHFRDPVKFLAHPITSAKHKGSVLTRIAADVWTGRDWAERPFTTWRELFGIDDKGQYKTTQLGHHYRGQPKGGKLGGRLVRKGPYGRTVPGVETVPSQVLYELRQSAPIPVQSGIAWLAGEMDAFDALTKAAGMMTATSYEKGD
jgi:hypothetical protein